MTSSEVTNGVVIEGIRGIYAAADQEGRERPGRPTLLRLLRTDMPNLTEHQVRQAKDQVDAEVTSSPPAPASTAPAAASLADGDATPPPAGPPDPPQQTALGAPALQPGGPAGGRLTNAAPGKAPRPWPLVLIGLAAAVAVWSGWVGLGEMAGFGPINLLPGVGSGWTVNSAIVLPVSVEAYAAYALRVWLSTSYHSQRTIRFARFSTYASLVVGGLAQVGYHLLAAAGFERAPWPVTMLVALVPVLVLGLASALAKLVGNDRQAGGAR